MAEEKSMGVVGNSGSEGMSSSSYPANGSGESTTLEPSSANSDSTRGMTGEKEKGIEIAEKKAGRFDAADVGVISYTLFTICSNSWSY